MSISTQTPQGPDPQALNRSKKKKSSNARTSQHEIVHRMGNLVQHTMRRLLDLSDVDFLGGRAPPRVEQLRKVNQGETLRGRAASGEMEDNGGLHGREERVPRGRDTVVHEIRLVDTPVFGFASRLTDDTRTPEGFASKNPCLSHVKAEIGKRTAPPCPSLRPHNINNPLHLASKVAHKIILPTSNHIVESDNLRVGDLPSRRQCTKRRQTIYHGLRELVSGKFLESDVRSVNVGLMLWRV